jgi:hypothetical protein
MILNIYHQQQQYEFRSKSNLRLKDPSEAVAMKSFYRSSQPNFEDNHAYGKPLGPGTPIKDILGNFFGSYAA